MLSLFQGQFRGARQASILDIRAPAERSALGGGLAGLGLLPLGLRFRGTARCYFVRLGLEGTANGEDNGQEIANLQRCKSSDQQVTGKRQQFKKLRNSN